MNTELGLSVFLFGTGILFLELFRKTENNIFLAIVTIEFAASGFLVATAF